VVGTEERIEAELLGRLRDAQEIAVRRPLLWLGEHS
jgi:hypothetical protein